MDQAAAVLVVVLCVTVVLFAARRLWKFLRTPAPRKQWRTVEGPSGEEIHVPFGGWKFWLLMSVAALFIAVFLVVLLVDPSARDDWEAWAGLVLFGVIPVFLLRRFVRRGLLQGKPALLLTREKLVDNQNGVEISWAEIEKVTTRTVYTRGGELSFIVVHPKSEEVVLRQLGGFLAWWARATARFNIGDMGPGVFLSIPLQFVKGSLDEVAAAIRTYYDGPFEGYDPDFEHHFADRKLKTRGRRLAAWLVEWTILIAIGIGIAVVLARCEGG